MTIQTAVFTQILTTLCRRSTKLQQPITLLNTYGKQEGEGFNFHYQAHGYHPLLCYGKITGDLLKAELRNGTQYCSNDADKFMILLLQEYRVKYPSLPLYLRGDGGFASPDLYKACEDNDCKCITIKIFL